MKTRLLAAAVAAVALVGGCSAPKSVPYKSVLGDFKAVVPWGWSVTTDSVGNSFAQVDFIGPFDGDFFLGAPSLSVRWYKRYGTHRLRGGSLEMYTDAADFFEQTLKNVYGERESIVYGPGQREDGGREVVKRPEDLKLKGSGLAAKYFIILSPEKAPESNLWGVEKDRQGHAINMRMHAYALVEVEGGFYVLCYPATRRGFDKYEDSFRTLLGSFRPLTAGPGGPKVRLAAPTP